MEEDVIDNDELLALVKEIDEDGEGLTRGEIKFIARIVDERLTFFTAKEDEKIRRIYQKRVIDVPTGDENDSDEE